MSGASARCGSAILLCAAGVWCTTGGARVEAQDAVVPPPPPEQYTEVVPPPPQDVPPPPPAQTVAPPQATPPAPPSALPPVAPLPPAAAPPEPGVVSRVRSGFTAVGIGGGGWLLTGNATSSAAAHPLIGLEVRKVSMVDAQVGIELVTNFAFHDFEAIGDAYAWWGIEDEWQFWKFAVLWEGLILAPLVGSHIVMGPGVVIFSSVAAPSFFGDLGFALSMFLRPSDSRFLFGLGAFGGIGLEISAHATALLRMIWGPPTVNSWFTDIDDHVLSGMLLIEWVR